jgi:hypothetical protein
LERRSTPKPSSDPYSATFPTAVPILSVGGGFNPPTNDDEAVALLLDRCSELIPAWEELRGLFGDNKDEPIGIYIVLGQVILPFLLRALPGSDAWGEDAHVRADAQRRSMRDKAVWARMPSDQAGVEELLSRLYQVIDLWTASPSVELRHAVWTELVETGYVDLTVEDLVSHGGPLLRAMVNQATPNPELPT